MVAVASVALPAALALWLPCVLHTLPPARPGLGSPEPCVGSLGLPCPAQLRASPGPLGGSCWGRAGSQRAPASPVPCWGPREPLTGSFCHSGHWLRFQWSLWEFLAMALLC